MFLSLNNFEKHGHLLEILYLLIYIQLFAYAYVWRMTRLTRWVQKNWSDVFRSSKTIKWTEKFYHGNEYSIVCYGGQLSAWILFRWKTLGAPISLGITWTPNSWESLGPLIPGNHLGPLIPGNHLGPLGFALPDSRLSPPFLLRQ